MSEYPIQCDKCGKWGYVHATKYTKGYICDECNYEYAKEQGKI